MEDGDKASRHVREGEGIHVLPAGARSQEGEAVEGLLHEPRLGQTGLALDRSIKGEAMRKETEDERLARIKKEMFGKITEAKEHRDIVYCNILIYGQTGAGKSWLAATAPKPLVLLTEANGHASVAHSNPDALVVPVRTMDEMDIVLRSIHTGEMQQAHQFETLVIDSMTELQRLLMVKILARSNRTKMQLADWGDLANEMVRYIRAIRDLPCHVVCTALQDSYVDDDSGKRFVQPSFQGKKTVSVIAQFFNAVGLLYKRQGEGAISERLIMWDGPEWVMCKPCHPLAGVHEQPEMSDIVHSISTVKPKAKRKKKGSLKPVQESGAGQLTVL